MKFVDKILLAVDFAAIGVLLVVAVCNIVVDINASGRVFDDVDEIPHNRYGLLLGTAPKYCGGEKSYSFDYRIHAADELYKAHKVDYIIVSGGDYTDVWGSDEPVEIRDSLVARGIPPNRIILDHEGLRTINSVVKAREVYGLDSVTFISQKDHNRRAIWQADHYGLESTGYNARPTHVTYRHLQNVVREYLARVKMFIDLASGHKPEFKEKSIPVEALPNEDN